MPSLEIIHWHSKLYTSDDEDDSKHSNGRMCYTLCIGTASAHQIKFPQFLQLLNSEIKKNTKMTHKLCPLSLFLLCFSLCRGLKNPIIKSHMWYAWQRPAWSVQIHEFVYKIGNKIKRGPSFGFVLQSGALKVHIFENRNVRCSNIYWNG